MPSLAELAAAPPIRCLNCGRPGAGKTGGLASIVLNDPEARLFICNYDRNNISTLAGVIARDPKTNAARDPALVRRVMSQQVFYHNFQDDIRIINGLPMVTGTPTAFTSLGKKLNDWGPPFDPGKGISEAGPKDWLVLDSISAMGDAALRYSLNASSRLNKRPEQSDWGDAINRLSMILEMFNDPSLAFNVMAITHIRFVGDQEEGKDGKGQFKSLDMVPNALGQKLPQEIGRYFNNIIETRVVGEGPGARRLIYTRNPGGLVLRSSAPGAVKPEYDISALHEWVRDIRSAPIPAAPAAQPGATTPPTGA